MAPHSYRLRLDTRKLGQQRASRFRPVVRSYGEEKVAVSSRPREHAAEVEAPNEGGTDSSVQASVAGPSQRNARRNSLAPSSS
jgi:hypothetical protein